VLEDFRQAPLHPGRLYDCGESLPFANGYPLERSIKAGATLWAEGWRSLGPFTQRHSDYSQSFLFFVLILLLRELRTPDPLSRLQALSPDLHPGRDLGGSDPCDSELRSRMVILNFDLVSDLDLTSAPAELHTMVANIESVREMAILIPPDPEAYGHDRFGSLRLPFCCARSRHVHAQSE